MEVIVLRVIVKQENLILNLKFVENNKVDKLTHSPPCMKCKLENLRLPNGM
jgi:hypothetical protein